MRGESPLFVRTHDLLLWLIPQTHKFPRAHRFGLAERIQDTGMDFLDALVAAGKADGVSRAEHLKEADILLERLRAWLRMARDLEILSVRRYEHVARGVAEVGRLLGAWIKREKGMGSGR